MPLAISDSQPIWMNFEIEVGGDILSVTSYGTKGLYSFHIKICSLTGQNLIQYILGEKEKQKILQLTDQEWSLQ